MLKVICEDEGLMPVRAHRTDAGLDLKAAEGYTLYPGEVTKVHTGIRVEIPKGYAGFIYPRSGLAIDHGVTLVNTVGVIDSDYRGEIICALTAREQYFIYKYERIAQMVIQPVSLTIPQKYESLQKTVRGEGGFGHTGKH